MKIGFDLNPLQKLRTKIDRFAGAIGPAMEDNRQAFTLRLLAQTRQNASGRPGPQIVTGMYYNAFMIVDGRVVNPSPQTARLEYGFVGIDSLGRQYHQPAFPHFRPALATVGKEFRASIGPLIIATWRRS